MFPFIFKIKRKHFKIKTRVNSNKTSWKIKMVKESERKYEKSSCFWSHGQSDTKLLNIDQNIWKWLDFDFGSKFVFVFFYFWNFVRNRKIKILHLFYTYDSYLSFLSKFVQIGLLWWEDFLFLRAGTTASVYLSSPSRIFSNLCHIIKLADVGVYEFYLNFNLKLKQKMNKKVGILSGEGCNLPMKYCSGMSGISWVCSLTISELSFFVDLENLAASQDFEWGGLLKP